MAWSKTGKDGSDRLDGTDKRDETDRTEWNRTTDRQTDGRTDGAAKWDRTGEKKRRAGPNG